MAGALKLFFAELTGDDATLQAALHELGATIGRVVSPQLESPDLRTVDPRLAGSSPVAQFPQLAGERLTNGMGGGDIPSREDPAASTSDAAGEDGAYPTWDQVRAAKRGRGKAKDKKPARRGRPPKATAAAPVTRGRKKAVAKKVVQAVPTRRRGEGGLRERCVAYLQQNGSPQKKSTLLAVELGASKGNYAIFNHPSFVAVGRGLVGLADRHRQVADQDADELLDESDNAGEVETSADESMDDQRGTPQLGVDQRPLRTPAASPAPVSVTRKPGRPPSSRVSADGTFQESAIARARDRLAAELCVAYPLTVSRLVKLTSFDEPLVRLALKDDRFETEAGGWQLAEVS